MFNRRMHLAAAAALSLLLVACGNGGVQPLPEGDAAGSACLVGDETCYETGGEAEPVPAGMCVEGVEDCVDTIVEDVFPTEAARQDAHGVIGMFEEDLPADVRISRRGAELMAVTEDYVLGRLTAELDDVDGSGFRVVSVTVELPEGPETFELKES